MSQNDLSDAGLMRALLEIIEEKSLSKEALEIVFHDAQIQQFLEHLARGRIARKSIEKILKRIDDRLLKQAEDEAAGWDEGVFSDSSIMMMEHQPKLADDPELDAHLKTVVAQVNPLESAKHRVMEATVATVQSALDKARGDVVKAAELVGLPVGDFCDRMREFGIESTEKVPPSTPTAERTQRVTRVLQKTGTPHLIAKSLFGQEFFSLEDVDALFGESVHSDQATFRALEFVPWSPEVLEAEITAALETNSKCFLFPLPKRISLAFLHHNLAVQDRGPRFEEGDWWLSELFAQKCPSDTRWVLLKLAPAFDEGDDALYAGVTPREVALLHFLLHAHRSNPFALRDVTVDVVTRDKKMIYVQCDASGSLAIVRNEHTMVQFATRLLSRILP